MLRSEKEKELVEGTLPTQLSRGLPGCTRPPVKGQTPEVHFSAGLFPSASESVHFFSDRAPFYPAMAVSAGDMDVMQPGNNERADNAHKRSAPSFPHHG
jgi:hypothetical protein